MEMPGNGICDVWVRLGVRTENMRDVFLGNPVGTRGDSAWELLGIYLGIPWGLFGGSSW